MVAPLDELQRLGRRQPGLPLAPVVGVQDDVVGQLADRAQRAGVQQGRAGHGEQIDVGPQAGPAVAPVLLAVAAADAIGRASCRERVCPYAYISAVAVSLKKKKT